MRIGRNHLNYLLEDSAADLDNFDPLIFKSEQPSPIIVR
jgi:hypothetical protein